MDALVEEAAKKAAVAWVAVGGRPAKLVWCAWLGGALLVVTGEGEQSVPGLAEAAGVPSAAIADGPRTAGAATADGARAATAGGARAAVAGRAGAEAAAIADAARADAARAGAAVEVSLRGDHGGRIVTFPAEVSRIAPDDEAWAELVPQLAGKRLNGAGGAEDLARAWAERCVVCRLTPVGGTAPMPDDSQAAPPRPTPATRIPRRPFRLHKVRGATRNPRR
ncbi:hypothetical protein GCM10022255_021920 [Dactylosporangium darangshiense]|uniref:Uncharacterized protein n=1 Tax=Dactylosporangium darangshiense TaxID=579108 RepID=A0ABP8D584_9ACTN